VVSPCGVDSTTLGSFAAGGEVAVALAASWTGGGGDTSSCLALDEHPRNAIRSRLRYTEATLT